MRTGSHTSYSQPVTAMTANYLISIRFFRIYSRKSTVRRLGTTTSTSPAVVEVNEGEDEEEVEVKEAIRTTIMKGITALATKKPVGDMEDLEEVGVVAAEAAVEAVITVKTLQESVKPAIASMTMLHATIVTKQVMDGGVANKRFKVIVRIQLPTPLGTAILAMAILAPPAPLWA